MRTWRPLHAFQSLAGVDQGKSWCDRRDIGPGRAAAGLTFLAVARGTAGQAADGSDHAERGGFFPFPKGTSHHLWADFWGAGCHFSVLKSLRRVASSNSGTHP